MHILYVKHYKQDYILSTLNFHTFAQRRNILSLIYKMIVNGLMFDPYNTSFAEL